MSSESTNSRELLATLRGKRENLRLRDLVVRGLRRSFQEMGFLEVETPLLLKTVATEEHIQPFTVEDRYLATSPELEMKLLVASGICPVFQFSRSFRKGEHGRRHNPEFSILEWYRAGSDLEILAKDLEVLLRSAAMAIHGAHQFSWQGRDVDLSVDFERLTVQDAFLRWAGWDPLVDADPDRFEMDLVERVEPHLGRGRPTFLVEYPVAMGSLAQAKEQDPRVALRGELYLEGVELANGFVELRNSDEQRARFLEAAQAIRAQGRSAPPMPEHYLSVLDKLPPTVGIALGVDRLVMLLVGADCVSEVRPFDFLEA